MWKINETYISVQFTQESTLHSTKQFCLFEKLHYHKWRYFCGNIYIIKKIKILHPVHLKIWKYVMFTFYGYMILPLDIHLFHLLFLFFCTLKKVTNLLLNILHNFTIKYLIYLPIFFNDFYGITQN